MEHLMTTTNEECEVFSPRSEEIARVIIDTVQGELNVDIVCAALNVILNVLRACPIRAELSSWIEDELPHVLMSAANAGTEYDQQGNPSGLPH
jgi:hypothetical protein